jgi:hypothetical protein
MPEKKTHMNPTGSYDFKLMIEDLDYSQDLIRIRVASSITAPYQSIIFHLNLDPNDVILKRVYGQSTFKLTIILLTEDNKVREQFDIELMSLDSKFQVNTRDVLTQNVQKDRQLVEIKTVCQKPFKIMTTIVNEVYHAKTTKEIIEDLVSKTDAELEYEEVGENKNIIDQVIIPPSTLYNCIKQMDKIFGVYNGVMILYCMYDAKLYVKNLNQNMKMAQTFTMYQIATGDKKFKEIVDKCADGKHFYTSQPVITNYTGNAAFSILAPTLRYIVKPRDTLFYTIEKNLSEFCIDYGLMSNEEAEIYYNETGLTDKRIKYYKDQTGYDKDETFVNAGLSKAVSTLVTLSMDIDRDIKIFNLMKVGESVSFIPRTLEMNQLTNKYILRSSEINFSKSGTWQGSARVHLIRTNRSSN